MFLHISYKIVFHANNTPTPRKPLPPSRGGGVRPTLREPLEYAEELPASQGARQDDLTFPYVSKRQHVSHWRHQLIAQPMFHTLFSRVWN
jgi:hypothetical protein